MSRPVCGVCMCLIDETGCGCNGQAEELIKIMESNNEPVAWMHKNPNYPISKHRSLEYNIPLYTTPQDQADRIAELEADVEKKVVMIGLWESKFKELAEATGFAGYLAGMMVFEDKTPQIKELSDEEIIKNFLAKQTQLPPEFLKVLHENLWNLYES